MSVESWESLEALGTGDQTTSDQGASAPAVPAMDPAPANPSEEVASKPADTNAAANVDATGEKPAADATDASAGAEPAAAQPPASPKTGAETVDPSKQEAATGEEEETEADKAEFKDLPPAAQAPARRYRKEARQFRSFKTEIGGEPFLDDAKAIVPAFHTKPAPDFDAVLQERSPAKRRELYNHMVHSAIDTEADRQVLIDILANDFRTELEAKLGVQTPKANGQERTPESHVEPQQLTTDQTAQVKVLDDLLTDPYCTAEQRVALEAAKASMTKPQPVSKPDKATEARLAQLQNQLDEVLTEKKTSQTQSYEQEEQALGGEFIGEVMTFAGTRLNELGLSAAEGDSPELAKFIAGERKKILDLLPTRFESHENAKRLIDLLTDKFKQIPKMDRALKEAEKRAAWKFLAPVKTCVDDILGNDVADALHVIETSRSARQAPLNQDQRKEIVGHETPGQHPDPKAIVKGQGVDALWADLTGLGQDEFRA